MVDLYKACLDFCLLIIKLFQIKLLMSPNFIEQLKSNKNLYSQFLTYCRSVQLFAVLLIAIYIAKYVYQMVFCTLCD